MSKAPLEALESHFSFGENWRDFLANVDSAAITSAEKGLLDLIPRERLSGSRFMDIGCGSGLHTLAALRLGVRETTSLDIDPNSVAATKDLLARHAPNAPATVEVGSIFELEPSSLGNFDIVYSWGVLHHTGNMWDAVECASRFVAPGGLFVIALYEKTLLCDLWRVEKRVYKGLPKPVQTGARAIYKTAYTMGLIATGRNPRKYYDDYKANRGMNIDIDMHDWMGGYPYESASDDETCGRLEKLGFRLLKQIPARPKKKIGVLGAGCLQYTFERV